MFETINERVNVLAGFKQRKNRVEVRPYLMDWRGERYPLTVFGLYHPARRGEKFLHVFEYASGNAKFRLEMDSETLEWTLTEVYHDYST